MPCSLNLWIFFSCHFHWWHVVSSRFRSEMHLSLSQALSLTNYTTLGNLLNLFKLQWAQQLNGQKTQLTCLAKWWVYSKLLIMPIAFFTTINMFSCSSHSTFADQPHCYYITVLWILGTIGIQWITQKHTPSLHSLLLDE